MRAIINSDTFYEIFKDKEEVLAMMVASLTRIDRDKLENNITSDINNPKKLDYVVWMPEDYILKIKNFKSNDIITIDLNDKKM